MYAPVIKRGNGKSAVNGGLSWFLAVNGIKLGLLSGFLAGFYHLSTGNFPWRHVPDCVRSRKLLDLLDLWDLSARQGPFGS